VPKLACILDAEASITRPILEAFSHTIPCSLQPLFLLFSCTTSPREVAPTYLLTHLTTYLLTRLRLVEHFQVYSTPSPHHKKSWFEELIMVALTHSCMYSSIYSLTHNVRHSSTSGWSHFLFSYTWHSQADTLVVLVVKGLRFLQWKVAAALTHFMHSFTYLLIHRWLSDSRQSSSVSCCSYTYVAANRQYPWAHGALLTIISARIFNQNYWSQPINPQCRFLLQQLCAHNQAAACDEPPCARRERGNHQHSHVYSTKIYY
jgi:hypothetical protein